MRRNLAGKRAVVTGASGGIGRAIAEALAAAGAKVVVTARSADKLSAVTTAIMGHGGTAVAVPADITVPADRERIIQAAVSAFGGLDLLVNNAGVASWGHFSTSTEAINRRVLEVNFFAPVELTRLAIPHLTAGDQPAVVNVTSMTGRRGMPAWPEYSASKAALVGMSEAWRGEFVRFGVGVITIVPGLTKTDLNSHLLRSDGRAKLPFELGMTPEQVARAVVAAIRSNRAEVVLGTEARRLLRVNQFFPRLVTRLLGREVTKLYQEV